MIPYERLENELSKNKTERRPIKLGRSIKYIISKDRINYLFDNYFQAVNFEDDYIGYLCLEEDLVTLLAVLRGHFKVWVEVDSKTKFLNVYKIFPNNFIITEEVNKQNHWFAQETFEKGTVLHLANDNYGTINWLNGIPLTRKLNKTNEGVIYPVMQINYEFIEPYFF